MLYKKFRKIEKKCLPNLWQKNFENGNVFGNIDLSIFNTLFNSYFIHTIQF